MANEDEIQSIQGFGTSSKDISSDVEIWHQPLNQTVSQNAKVRICVKKLFSNILHGRIETCNGNNTLCILVILLDKVLGQVVEVFAILSPHLEFEEEYLLRLVRQV